ncbi:hypothetical protein OIV83_005759 [Microbotryomycetes sp. JL201]|nr:hypothetical protein OIV83_005759 [Microbotryomycetes sp. JL201]
MASCFIMFAAGDADAHQNHLDKFAALERWMEEHAQQYGLATSRVAQLDEIGKETLAAVYPEPIRSFEPPESLDLPPLKLDLSTSSGLIKTVNNFRALLTNEKRLVSKQKAAPLKYEGSKVFRIEKDFALQAGDVTRQDGSGGESIYGGAFNDDREGLRTQFEYGTLAMANSGKNSNTSQFFIVLTTDPARLKKLTGKYVAFGKVDVDDADSRACLERLNELGTPKGTPKQPVWINRMLELSRLRALRTDRPLYGSLRCPREAQKYDPRTNKVLCPVTRLGRDKVKLTNIRFEGVRFHSSVIQRRTEMLNQQIPPYTMVDLGQIMRDLRDLELYEKLRNVRAKSATGFKDATRALYPLFHRIDSGQANIVTFQELQSALPPIFSVPWTHIAERLTSGKVSALDGLTDYEKAAINFLRINNVGSVRAYEFVDAGARTFQDLEALAAAGKIKLTHSQRVGLVHLEDIERLIPRSEMDLLASTLADVVRRKAEFSSDIDLTLRHASFVEKDNKATACAIMTKVVAELEKRELVKPENQLMNGWKKYAVSFSTCSGDALLMKLLRHTAKQKAIVLDPDYFAKKKKQFDNSDQNPNGFRPGTLKVVTNEREIFDLLGLPWLEPEERDYSTWREKYLGAGVDLSYVHKL